MTFDDLSRLTEAEEWFDALGVPFDATALAPVRLAVLKRFGVELQAIAGRLGATDAERLDAARIALAHAYAALRAKQARGPVWRGPVVQLRRPLT
jgi:nitrogenase-stabilizing/protective protein